MIKINSAKALAFATALTASASVFAHNSLQKTKGIFPLENYSKTEGTVRDEFVSQTNSTKTDTYTEKAVKNVTRSDNISNADFDKAVAYYNETMDYRQRYDVTKKTYSNLETRLYNMEKAIDQAYVDCEAYGDIMIVPRWHYRFYPNFSDRYFINFDIEEVRNHTSKDMESLYELKDKVEYILEEANGRTEHTTPQKTEYDIEKLAEKHLGMPYAEFAEKYKDELELCKTVTYADLASMDQAQRLVYSKARAYAKEMLQITTNEAHTVNWETGRKRVDETLKASNDMISVSEFEDDGITEDGLNSLESGIMRKAFEDALIEKYNELSPTGLNGTTSEQESQKPVKRVVDGKVLIYNPNGTVYDLNGHRVN